jgi:recombinational DNA repair protein RecT
MSTENKNQLVTLQNKLAAAGSAKAVFELKEVEERFVKNYEAVTGRKDGTNRLEQEKFAYLQRVADNPDLRGVDPFYHYSALVYAATTGLSFRDNQLYLIPNGKTLKIQSSPAAKRYQLELMPEMESAPEAIVVMTGDHFVHDKLNSVVKEHYTTEKSSEILKLDNVRAVYQRLKYKNGKVVDVVVYKDDLIKAKGKSRMKSDQGLWEQWPLEAAKKTATNRAFRLYHKYPDNTVVFAGVEADEETADVNHEEVLPTSTSVETVDQETGEVQAEEAQVVQEEKPKKEKTSRNLID